MHVYADGTPYSEAKVLVENNLPGPPVNREMFSLINNGGSQFSFADTSNGRKWIFRTSFNGVFSLSLDGSGGNEFTIAPNGRVTMGPGNIKNFDLAPNGNLTIKGTLTQSSDKNLKTAFVSVDATDVLERVAAMPVQTWQFKFDKPGLRHMGPTAQDFHEAFGLGENDKTLAPVDGIGVSLAAIKALHEKGVEKDKRIEKLETELSSCRKCLDQQQAILMSLNSRLEQLEVVNKQ